MSYNKQEQIYQAAQKFFPRGLYQPEGSFRFSIDALLLSSFFKLDYSHKIRVTELGSGCGVVLIGLLLRDSDKVIKYVGGIEKQFLLYEASKVNLTNLGFFGKSYFWNFELGDDNIDSKFWPDGQSLANSSDIVLMNPPYRVTGSGRLPAKKLRRDALFAKQDALKVFCKSAYKILKEGGKSGAIINYSRFEELKDCAHLAGFNVSRVMYIHPYKNSPPNLVLLEFIKPFRAELLSSNKEKIKAEENSLIIYEKTENIVRSYTSSALNFCPFLQCNSSTF